MFAVVAYDISDEKRLRRAAKLMESYGARVQRSVFECRLTQQQLEDLAVKIKALIKHNKDKVSIYKLCEICRERAEITNRIDKECDEDIFVY